MTLTDLMERINALDTKITKALESTVPEDVGKPRRRVQTKVRKTLYESDIVRIKQLLELGAKTNFIADATGFSERTVRYVKAKARDYVLTRRAV